MKPSHVSFSKALLVFLRPLNTFGSSLGRVTVRFQVWLLFSPRSAVISTCVHSPPGRVRRVLPATWRLLPLIQRPGPTV
jgi:hypothetical protein